MTVSVNQFRANLKQYVDRTLDIHEPLKVDRKNGEPFVVLSWEDYAREQETLYVLGNKNLMSQIEASLTTFNRQKGHTPTPEELNLDGDA
jgi:antitoxin YefM